MNEYKLVLEGLNCAHCAAKIEAEIKKEYTDATFNFINKQLCFSSDKNADDIILEIQNVVNSIEEGVVVKKYKPDAELSGNSNENSFIKMGIIRLIIGGIAFFAGLLMDKNIYLLIFAYIVFGFDVIFRAVKNILKGRIFDENFLMSIATVGALFIGEYPEAVAVMLFFQIGEFFQDMAVDRSRRSIKELMDLKIEFVNKMDDKGNIIKTEPEKIKTGDIILVKAGEKVPLDSMVIEGESYIDTSALTGEAVPIKVRKGDKIKSGVINKEAVLKLEVEKLYSDSTVVKIMEMVENASIHKSKVENIITKFAGFYTPVVVFCAVVIAVIPFLMGAEFTVWLDRALIFLVSSCPCALVISVPLSFFSGIGKASRNGILVKGSNYLQMLSDINTVVFDKTGTITEGIFKVQNYSDDKTLQYAASLEKYSNHPLAGAIVEEYKGELLEAMEVSEISGYGITGKIGNNTVIAGNNKLMEKENIKNFTAADDTGVYVAVNGEYAGFISVSDCIRQDSAKAINELRNLGIQNVVMLTGDNESAAGKVAALAGIDTFYANLLPQDKVERLETLLKCGNKTAFVGDGINDAPVLARADVGIAMGGIGSDAAIEAADVVIMNDSLVKLSDAVKIARKTIKIIKQNIVFVLIVKFAVLILAACGLGNMWLAVFADVGVALLAILNAVKG